MTFPKIILESNTEITDTPIIFFRNDSDLSFKNLDISSQGVDTFLFCNNRTNSNEILNCIIDKSLSIEINKSNSLVIRRSNISVNRPIELSNINNINITDTDINLLYSINNPIFFTDNVIDIDYSDVFNFQCSINIIVEDPNTDNFNYIYTDNCYAKNIDISYESTLINLGRSNILFSDSTNCTII